MKLTRFHRAGPNDLVPEGTFDIFEASGNRYIAFTLPENAGGFRCLPIAPGPAMQGAWGWDGNEDAPTLSPSIKCFDGAEKVVWHGHLDRGELTNAGDSPVQI